eukprot:CAMPEP_0177670956 /NCGR_PEP_ID=MMETSP0447-20121125/24397_1 /TAXON_ID=0 /ORGANISM="Stygamoeba regulata, Strain BSH-02190019" /LENGTH=243 /DNA_ID=CAMNT_0019178217 /DNA_START=154 /DNA_END=885 /DNA_ORIENTATION=-
MTELAPGDLNPRPHSPPLLAGASRKRSAPADEPATKKSRVDALASELDAEIQSRAKGAVAVDESEDAEFMEDDFFGDDDGLSPVEMENDQAGIGEISEAASELIKYLNANASSGQPFVPNASNRYFEEQESTQGDTHVKPLTSTADLEAILMGDSPFDVNGRTPAPEEELEEPAGEFEPPPLLEDNFLDDDDEDAIDEDADEPNFIKPLSQGNDDLFAPSPSIQPPVPSPLPSESIADKLEPL